MGTEALPPNEDRGPSLMAAVLPLTAIAFVVYAARIWSRLYPKNTLTYADYAITISMFAKALSIGFMVIAIQNGFGRHNAYIPRDDIGIINNHLLGVFMTGVVVSGFARISIASLLLRLTSSLRWRVGLWTLIVIQVLFIISYQVVQVVQCRGVIANKTTIRGTQCMSRTQVWSFSFVSIGVAMVSDMFCTALPVLVIWRLSRSTLEKVLVIILVGSSLLATACGIPKIYYLATYEFGSKDGFWNLLPTFFWGRMEEGLIIIAACAPLLKGPAERLMHRFGLPTFGMPTRDLNRVSSVALGSKSEGSWRDEGRRRWSIPSDMEGGTSTISEGVIDGPSSISTKGETKETAMTPATASTKETSPGPIRETPSTETIREPARALTRDALVTEK